MSFRIPENWDNERKFSTKDVEYTTDEVVEIMLKAKDYYNFETFTYHNHIDSIIQFCYHLNDDHISAIKKYLPKDFIRTLETPKYILKLYLDTPGSKRRHMQNIIRHSLSITESYPHSFEAFIICDYYEFEYLTDLISKFNDLQHDLTMEKVIKFCVTDIFNKKETIKILIAYVNKFKKIPDAIMDYLKDECSTSELHEKHFTDELLDYCSANMTLSLDHILCKYVNDYDKIIVNNNIKSMLLAFKTLHEDLPNDGKKHYKVSKELIDNILEHPGFDKYVNSKFWFFV